MVCTIERADFKSTIMGSKSWGLSICSTDIILPIIISSLPNYLLTVKSVFYRTFSPLIVLKLISLFSCKTKSFLIIILKLVLNKNIWLALRVTHWSCNILSAKNNLKIKLKYIFQNTHFLYKHSAFSGSASVCL